MRFPALDAIMAWFILCLWLFYAAILLLIAIYDFRNFVVLDQFLYIAMIVAFVSELVIFFVSKYSSLLYTKGITFISIDYYRVLGGYAF